MLTKKQEHRRVEYEYTSSITGEKVELTFIETTEGKFITLKRENVEQPEVWDADMLLDIANIVAQNIAPKPPQIVYRNAPTNSAKEGEAEDVVDLRNMSPEQIQQAVNETMSNSDGCAEQPVQSLSSQPKKKKTVLKQDDLWTPEDRMLRVAQHSRKTSVDMYPEKGSGGKGFSRGSQEKI